MSNALIRIGSSFTYPGVPYQPAQAAYESYDTFTGYRVGPPIKVGAWVTIRVPRVGGGTSDSDERTVWDPNYTVASNVAYTYSVLTYHPATPEVLGSPSVRVDNPPQGWTSFAHSAKSVYGTGEAKFKVNAGVTGVAVGLANYSIPTSGYGHITHGLLFTGGKVYSLRTGSLLATFTSTDEFTVRVSATTVTFLKAGSSIGTEASLYANEPLYLSSAMYGARDMVTAPSLTALASAKAAMTIPSAVLFATQGAKAQALMTAPLATMAGYQIANAGRLAIPMAQMYGSDRSVYGDAAMTIPAPVMLSYGGLIAVELRTTADMLIPMAAMTGHMFAGQIGSGALTIPMAVLLAADRPYAEARMAIPAPTMLGYDESQSMGFVLESIVADFPLVGTVVDQVTMAWLAAFSFPLTAQSALAVEMPWPAVMSFDLTASTISTAEMDILAMFDFPLTVPSDDAEVWVTNLAHSGSTSYSNFVFNSFANIGGRYFGAGAGGIFELDGDDDAGKPIRAALSLGVKDFGSAQKKTLVECFVSMSGTGPLLMKLVANHNEFIYTTGNYSDQLQMQRFKFGKGKALQANYLTPIIYNEDGTDFELESITFEVADLQRKLGR